MQKLKLALIPVCMGIILLFFSWYVSYPVSIDSRYDFIYNHISPLYWLGSLILFASLFIIAINTKNNIIRWIIAVSTVLLMYSLSYFYYMVPGSDSHGFRGLTEYFISTGDLSSTPPHRYYQWPLFFVINKVATSITGLDLRYFEFILYGTIGFVLATSLYLYASKASANGYVAVVAFFIIQKYFFNYQWAPFSVSTSLLLLLFVLDRYAFSMTLKREVTLATLIIFFSVTLTHAFVPVFFIIYSFMMYIVNKNQKYLNLFLSTLIIYLTVSIYYAATSFSNIVQSLTRVYTLEYSARVESTLASSVAPTPYIDIVAQIFSRTVIITTTIVTGFGFIILLIKRKVRKIDYAMLLTGVLYVAIGFLLPILGSRAFFIITIPLSLGASYLMESKFKRYFRPLLLTLIILFTFVLIHGTFDDRYIQFQTKEAYTTANFMIERYDWTPPSTVLSHVDVNAYIRSKIEGNAILETDLSLRFLEMNVEIYDCIVCSVGLEKTLFGHNFSTGEISRQIENRFNMVYNSGSSYIAIRANATN